MTDISIGTVTTDDKRSVYVEYSVSGLNSDAPITFDVFRVSSFFEISSTTRIGSQVFGGASDTSVGQHQVRVALDDGLLAPDPSKPFIYVLADAANTVDETNETNNLSYFRKFTLGIVTHGYTLFGKSLDPWVVEMAEGLKIIGKYDDVITKNWTVESRANKPNRAVIAGHELSAVISAKVAMIMAAHIGDVVDLHFIGHSRGVVVNSVAMIDLNATPGFLYRGTYIKATMLDPHPANNYANRPFSTIFEEQVQASPPGNGPEHSKRPPATQWLSFHLM